MPAPGSLSRVVAAAVLTVGLVASGCGKDEPSVTDKTPAEVMAAARQLLDETSGVQLDLTSTGLPSNVSGILSGTGIGTHDPAFEGQIKVQMSGISADVPVTAVGGKVYAQLPFTPSQKPIDPAKYGAPDPAALFSTDEGISSLLTQTQGLARGETVRGGPSNEEILTEYTGTLPATLVTRVIPSATGDDFAASYQVADTGELREVVLTGEFYPDAGDITYTLTLTNYGITKDITAP